MSRRFTSFVALLVMAICSSFMSMPQAHATPPVSPFMGSWDGPFTTTLGGSGHVTMHIANNGLITGHAIHYQTGLVGELRGHINGDGFGFFVFLSQPNLMIPYLVFASFNGNGDVEVIAPVPSGAFTVLATLHPE